MRRVAPFAVLSLCLALPAISTASADDDWCARVAGGPSGQKDLALDLSAAHAAIRFFGSAQSTLTPDQALAAALDPPGAFDKDGTSMLQDYAGRLDDVCLVATGEGRIRFASPTIVRPRPRPSGWVPDGVFASAPGRRVGFGAPVRVDFRLRKCDLGA